MVVLLRLDGDPPDVAVAATQWDYCTLKKLDGHIRTLQAARKWLVEELRVKEAAEK